ADDSRCTDAYYHPSSSLTELANPTAIHLVLQIFSQATPPTILSTSLAQQQTCDTVPSKSN
ncbi:hypothetical protein A2U01_0092591, partial [Trifolium medium]|nr:hypothetical protein [Trifolium medium]